MPINVFGYSELNSPSNKKGGWYKTVAVLTFAAFATYAVWWELSPDACAFIAHGEIIPGSVDQLSVQKALKVIRGVFPSDITIDEGNVEISGTISAPRWWPDPGHRIKDKLESLGMQNVSVSGYY